MIAVTETEIEAGTGTTETPTGTTETLTGTIETLTGTTEMIEKIEWTGTAETIETIERTEIAETPGTKETTEGTVIRETRTERGQETEIEKDLGRIEIADSETVPLVTVSDTIGNEGDIHRVRQ